MVRFLHRERALIIILLIGLIMRLNDLIHAGYLGDMVSYNVPWSQTIQQFGLFKAYSMSLEINYPPIYLFILKITSSIISPVQGNSIPLGFLILTKLFSVIAELSTIGIVYSWISNQTRLKWAVPLALALHPGLIATTAFWGQTDSILTLLLVLSIIAINRNQKRMSWVWFSLALLMKFQAIVLLPMLGIISLRRFGIRSTFLGILITGAIFGLVLAPFIISSGVIDSLRPFIKATDRYPVITANAFNLWYLTIPSLWSLLPTNASAIPLDTHIVISNLSIRQISLLLFSSYILLITFFMWRRSSAQREFVWAAALYIGFFMLPTQMHERYLYPASVFSFIAIVQERRMWPIATMLLFSYTINIVVIPDVHFYWFGLDLKTLLSGSGLLAAVLNLLCLTGVILLIIRDRYGTEDVKSDNQLLGYRLPKISI